MEPLKHNLTSKRTRKIIYNDDADAATHYADKYPTVKDFLAARFNWCINSQVDSYFWCIGNGQKVPWNEPYNPQLGDVHQVMVGAARKAGLEIFASLRMNDTHDAWTPALLPQEKIDHPECLIGSKDEYVPGAISLAHFSWSSWDYSHEWVRTYFLNFINDICARYDWDGLELDFCHMPLYFKYAETEQNCATMTAFVKEVRESLDRIAKARGREFLLAVTVPDTVEYSLRIGLDVQAWLSESMVDILIAGSGYKPYCTSYDELIDLGRRANVQVYSSINVSTTSPHHTLDQEGHVRERIRAAASNLWSQKPDGIYLFNLFVPAMISGCKESEDYSVLKEIGTSETLRSLDKVYPAEAPKTHSMYQLVLSPYVLPAALLECPHIPLRVTEKLEDMVSKQLTLRIRVTDMEEGQCISVRLNNNPLQITGNHEGPQGNTNYMAGGGRWFEADVDAAALRCGLNDIEVHPASWFKSTTMIEQVQLYLTEK